MIARVLSRFADASLRAELDKTRDARDQARDTARRLFRRLQAARATAATNKAQVERWKAIARTAQEQLAAERARTQETTR